MWGRGAAVTVARNPDRHEAAAAGADRYLAKLFSPLELLSVVEDLLERGQSRPRRLDGWPPIKAFAIP